MHVAILVKEFPPNIIGGTETQTQSMAQKLSTSGHEVTVYTKKYGRQKQDPHNEAPFQIVRVPNLRYSPFVSTLTFVAIATLYLIRDARQFDILQCMMIYPNGYIGLIVNALTNLPYFAWVRGGDFYFAKENSIKRRLIRSVLTRALVLVQTEQIADDIRAEFRDVDTNLFVVGNGVDVPTEMADGTDVVFVGRLVDQKGVGNLLRAMKDSGQHLRIVGDGPERERLESLSADLGISASFTGWVSPTKVGTHLSETKVFVLPSRRGEGLPNAVLEAMAHGSPVVATDTGGVANAIHDGKTGYVVPTDNIEQLRTRIIQLCRDDEKRRQMGSEARSHVIDTYAWPQIIAELEQIYERVVDGPK